MGIVERAVEKGRLHVVRVAPTALVVSNLCYADDKYAQVSGQIINVEKSTMTFSPGMQSRDQEAIQGCWGSRWWRNLTNI